MNPASRSLRLLRKGPYGFVEKTDLMGFRGCLAIAKDSALAVQSSLAADVAARFEKMRHLPAIAFWLQSPRRLIHIHGWRQVGCGKRKAWDCRTMNVYLTPDGEVAMAEPQRES